MFKLIEENHVNITVVPANCTDRLQPLDVSINKPVKFFLHQLFQEWYAQMICEQLHEPPTQVNAVQKWMIKIYNYIKSNPEIIRNEFKDAGITDFLRL